MNHIHYFVEVKKIAGWCLSFRRMLLARAHVPVFMYQYINRRPPFTRRPLSNEVIELCKDVPKK